MASQPADIARKPYVNTEIEPYVEERPKSSAASRVAFNYTDLGCNSEEEENMRLGARHQCPYTLDELLPVKGRRPDEYKPRLTFLKEEPDEEEPTVSRPTVADRARAMLLILIRVLLFLLSAPSKAMHAGWAAFETLRPKTEAPSFDIEAGLTSPRLVNKGAPSSTCRDVRAGDGPAASSWLTTNITIQVV